MSVSSKQRIDAAGNIRKIQISFTFEHTLTITTKSKLSFNVHRKQIHPKKIPLKLYVFHYSYTRLRVPVNIINTTAPKSSANR